jgi:hypothetical protein
MEVEAEIGSVPIPVRTGVNRRETFFKHGKAQASIVFRTELSQSAFSEVIVSHLYDKGWTQIDEWRFCRGDLDANLGLDRTEGNGASYWTLSFSYGYRPFIGVEYPKTCE